MSAMITAWGTWQPALDPNRRPSVSDALIGSLGDGSNGSQVHHRCAAHRVMELVVMFGALLLPMCTHKTKERKVRASLALTYMLRVEPAPSL